MIAIFALPGETLGSPFFAAQVLLLAEIPTAGPLTQIAADRRQITNLRRSGTNGDLGQCRPALGGVDASAVEFLNLVNVHQQRRRYQTFFQQIQEIHPTGLEHSVWVTRQNRCCGRRGPGLYICEAMHIVFSSPSSFPVEEGRGRGVTASA
jgi:hypothetical protein